jgi:hypothetical protein
LLPIWNTAFLLIHVIVLATSFPYGTYGLHITSSHCYTLLLKWYRKEDMMRLRNPVVGRFWIRIASIMVGTGVATLLLSLYTYAPPEQLPGRKGWLLMAAALVSICLLFGIGRWVRQGFAFVQESIPNRQKVAFALALVTALAATNVLSQFDGLLRGFHRSGDSAFGVDAATSVFTSPELRAQNLREAVATWSRFARPRSENNTDGCVAPSDEAHPLFPADCNVPITVLTWYSAIDSALLTPAYALLLILLNLWLRNAIAKREQSIEHAARDNLIVERFKRNARWVAVAALLAIAADWIENGTALWLITDAWVVYTESQWRSLEPLACGGIAGVCNFSVSLLSAMVWLKWLAIAFSVIYLLIATVLLVRWAGSDRIRGTVRSLVAVRIQLIVVAVFGVGLLVHEQVPDVLRRWVDSDGWRVAGWGFFTTLIFALSLCLTSQWMLDRATRYTPAPDALRWQVFWAWIGLFGILAWVNGTWKPLLPIVILLLIVVIGIPFLSFDPWPRDKTAGSIRRWLSNNLKILLGETFHNSEPAHPGASAEPAAVPGWGKRELPRLLPAIVFAIFGLALLRSSAGALLYSYLRTSDPEPLLQAQGAASGLLAGHLRNLSAQSLVWLVIGAGIVLLIASLIYWVLGFYTRWYDARASKGVPSYWTPIVLMGAVLAAWWGLIAWLTATDAIQWVGPAAGSLAILSAALFLIGLTGCATIAFVDQFVPMPAPLFRSFNLTRSPVVTLIGIWFLLASLLPPDESLHDVLPPDGRNGWQKEVRTGATLAALFDEWRCRNGLQQAGARSSSNQPCTPPTTRTAVPLVFVAASGGGIRAATWTSYVLDGALGYGTEAARVNSSGPGESRSDWVFAVSGVSGGSLGLANYAARLASQDPRQDSELVPVNPGEPARTPWVRNVLQRDSLAPTLGWLFFVETPWSLVRFDLRQDRAAVLEQSWDQAWYEQLGAKWNFFDLWQQPETGQSRRVPLLFFNGTSVESGCRFVAANIKTNGHSPSEPSARCLAPDDLTVPAHALFGATVDLVDFMCADEPLPLSKAALLSARFPLVSPSGHLKQCPEVANVFELSAPAAQSKPGDPAARVTDAERYPPETYVVDGGYQENSGAATALELWTALAPLVERHNNNPLEPATIVPLFIQVDNGYGEPAGPGAVADEPQFTVPLTTYSAAAGARHAMARQAAEIVFSQPYAIRAKNGTSAGVCIAERYAHFSLRAHPGPQAPLGWTLSETSFRDLVDQFKTNEAGQQPLELVNDWFNNFSRQSTPCSEE